MGEKSGVVGKVVHYYWIIESAKKWIMECVNEHHTITRNQYSCGLQTNLFSDWQQNGNIFRLFKR